MHATIISEGNKAYVLELDVDGSKECFEWFEASEQILMDECGDSSAQYIRNFIHEDYERSQIK